MFGPHLMMDCSKCDFDKLSSVDLVSQVLDEMPDAVGMTKIMPPYVFKYRGEVPEDWGVSGVVLIAESHISIHTFPEKGFMSIDIFSCKDFDVDKAVQFLVEKFNVGHYEKTVLQRGREFPRSRGRAGQIIDMERAKVASNFL